MDKYPLEGVRILDMTHSWAGPHTTRLMADFGAEVIRIEYPGRLCMFRGGITKNKAYDKQPPWLQVNRNKYCITLDLNKLSDKTLFLELVEIADIIVENSRPGVMDKLGIGYKKLCEINPGIILLSMSAFGSTGPLANYCGYGAAFEALSGIQSLTAYETNGTPQRIREMDVINGIGGTGALLNALIFRQRSGKGQHIDLSQMEFSSHLLIGEHLLEQEMNGSSTEPQGNRHRYYAPQGCYPCKGEDNWITLCVQTDEQWRSLCHVIGIPELKDNQRYINKDVRHKHHDEIDKILSNWSRTISHEDAMIILQQNGIPAGAVWDTHELANDPHLKARNYFIPDESTAGELYPGVPFKFTPPGKVRWPGQDLGSHNSHVVMNILKRSEQEAPTFQESELKTAYDTG